MPENIEIARIDLNLTPAEQAIAKLESELRKLRNNAETHLKGGLEKAVRGVEDAIQVTEKGMFSLNGQMNLLKSFLMGPAGIAVLIGATAFGMFEFGKGIIEAAEAAEKFNLQLAALSGSMKTAEEISKFINQEGLISPFSIAQLRAAAIDIKKFGGSVSELLPLAEKMSAAVGKDVAEAATVLGRAMQGDQRALLMLRREFGISAGEMEKFGIHMTGIKRGVALTSEQIEAMSKNIQALIQHHFPGAVVGANTLHGSIQQLKNGFQVAKEEGGKAILEALTPMVPALKSAAQWFAKTGLEVKFTIEDMFLFWTDLQLLVAAANAKLHGDQVTATNIMQGMDEKVRQHYQRQTQLRKEFATKAGKDESNIIGGVGDESKAAKIRELNESLAKKIEQIHAQTFEKKIQEKEAEIALSIKAGTIDQEKMNELQALLEKKHKFIMNALDVELKKDREKGADESKLAALRLAEEEKLEEEKNKIEERLVTKQEEAAKKQMDDKLKYVNAVRDLELLQEKKIMESLNEELKKEEEEQKAITEQLKEQNKEYEKKLKDVDEVNQILEQTSKHGGASGEQISRLTQLLGSAGAVQEAMFGATMGRKVSAGAAPTGGAAEEDLMGRFAVTKGKIETEKQKIQNIEHLEIKIDNQSISVSQPTPLSDATKQMMKVLENMGLMPNFQPQSQVIY